MSPNWPMVDQYIRRAVLVDVVDGDTVRMRVDCGYETFRVVRVRVNGIDTAEMRQEPARATHAKTVLHDILTGAKDIVIQTQRREMFQDEEKRTFERYVGDVYVDGESLVDAMKRQLTEEGGKWGVNRDAPATGSNT